MGCRVQQPDPRQHAELNQLGVLARENFTCCGTCAAAEIHDERDGSRHWHGYLWYHQQDTESLISSPDGSVYLGYGAYPPRDVDSGAYAALSEEDKRARYPGHREPQCPPCRAGSRCSPRPLSVIS